MNKSRKLHFKLETNKDTDYENQYLFIYVGKNTDGITNP